MVSACHVGIAEWHMDVPNGIEVYVRHWLPASPNLFVAALDPFWFCMLTRGLPLKPLHTADIRRLRDCGPVDAAQLEVVSHLSLSGPSILLQFVGG